MSVRFKKNPGFAITELLIVLFLVTMTIIIFLKSTDTFSRIGAARNQTKAYHVAAKKIEELRGIQFDSLPASGAFTDGSYQGQLTTTNYQSQADIKQITVTVNYTDQFSQKSVRLDTLISKYGLNP